MDYVDGEHKNLMVVRWKQFVTVDEIMEVVSIVVLKQEKKL